METPQGIPSTYDGRDFVYSWAYTDTDGEIIGHVARFENADDKIVVPFFERNGTGWKPGAAPKPRPLYNVKALATAPPETPVFIAEGERCAEAIKGLDGIATTSPGGSNAAAAADWKPLERFQRVYLLPDNDSPGEGYVKAVAAALGALPGHRKVFVVRLPDLPDGGDVVDWLKIRVPDWNGYGPVPREPGDELEAEFMEAVEAHAEPVPREWVESETVTVEPWETPVPLDAAVVPEWPPDIFPPDIQGYINALTESKETPVELGAMAVLAVLATAVQGKHRIQVKDDYFEPLCLWTCCALPPGSRKSAVIDATMSPLNQWEALKRAEIEPQIAEAESDTKTIQDRITELRKKARKAPKAELEGLMAEIKDLETLVPVIPTLPRTWTSDITPEHLAVLMGQNNECMSVLGDESGILDNAAGRYNSGIPNLDVFLQGHAGTAVRVDRGSRPPVFLQKPCLTVGIAPQPDVIQKLSDKPGFRGRGLLGRFLYAMPESNLGRRTGETLPMSPDIAQRYNSVVHALLNRPWKEDANGQPCASILKLSPEALELWRGFEHEIEAGLAPGGMFEHVTDWASKLAGAVARIAGIFHLARYAFENAGAIDVSQEDMSNAIRLGRVLEQHALIAFDAMGADPALDDARTVLSWIRREGLEVFTRREVHRVHKHRFRRVDEIEPVLDVLIERGYLRVKPQPVNPRGGRPSAVYEVNPAVHGGSYV